MKSFSRLISRFKQRIRTKKIVNPIDWEQHLISLYIVRLSDGICLYSHHFQLGRISQIETQLVGMGFTAISNMMQEIVDSSSHLTMMDLGERKVLIEERKNISSILVTTRNLPSLRKKLEELTDHFEKLFELQQQINLTTHVCLEDYALTSELISLIFSDRPKRVLEIVPIIFKSIRKKHSTIIKEDKSRLRMSTNLGLIFHQLSKK